MALCFGTCNYRACFKTLLCRGERAIGNLHTRGASRWGWMKNRFSGEGDAALQNLVDFCCNRIDDSEDRLDAPSEAELRRLLGALQVF